MVTKSSTPVTKTASRSRNKTARVESGNVKLEVEQGNARPLEEFTSKQQPLVKPSPVPKIPSTAAKITAIPTRKIDTSDPSPTPTKTRRTPRKLNKTVAEKPVQEIAEVTTQEIDAKPEASSELEALKSRVRGLEARVEQLYKSSAPVLQASRSPRRRGKNRKASLSTSTSESTLQDLHRHPSAMAGEGGRNREPEAAEVGRGGELADEQLVRLEGELELARQDLDSYRPRTDGRRQHDADLVDEEEVEEIPRSALGDTDSAKSQDTTRQVTLSGSYRIPIPTNVSLDDVKSIKSGVSAAQNLARGFLEQRRAVAATATGSGCNATSSASVSASASASASSRVATAGNAKNASPAVDMSGDDPAEKQSWGDWIGGYSMAITRAVKSIEHEAAVERGGLSPGGAETAVRTTRSGTLSRVPLVVERSGEKRPSVKSGLSNEQVHGLLR